MRSKTTKLALIALLTSLIFLMVNPAFAADIAPASISTPEMMSPDYLFNAKNLDPIEKNLFVQIFGGEFVGEDGSTALTKFLGYFNVAAMFLGVIIVGYVIFAGALNTAATGQVLGKNWSTVWLPLRISLGFGLIVPAAVGSNYSVVQYLVSKLLIASSIMATGTWNLVADDILAFNTSFTAGMPLPPSSQSFDLVGSAFCAVNEFQRRNGEGGSLAFPLYTIVVADEAGKSVVKAVRAGGGGSPYSMQGGAYIKSIRFGSTGNCGSIEVFDGAVLKEQSGTLAAVKAASKVVIDTLNSAHQLEYEARSRKVNSRTIDLYLLSSAHGSDEEAAKFKSESDKVFEAGAQIVSRYPSAMYQAITGGFKSGADLDKAREELMSQKSWLFAPMNYVRLAQHSMAPNSVFQKLGEGLSNSAWRKCQQGADDCPVRSPDEVVKATTTSYTFTSTMRVIGEIEGATNALNTGSSVAGASSQSLSSGEGASGCTGSACKEDSFVREYTSQARKIIFTADLMGVMGQGVADADADKQEGIGQVSIGNYNGGANPYYVLSGIGHALNTLLGVTWGLGFTAAGIAHGIGSSALSVAGGGAATGAFEFVLKTTWSLFIGMIMTGATLAYVIPMLPIIRWIWAVLNWLLLLVEAMTAAPLAVIMMVTPEGEGIAGSRAERGIMLITQIFFWPFLLVLSYIAMVGLSVVGFSFVNFVWFSDAIRYNDSGFFDLVAKVMVWAVIVTTLCHACAGIIDTLPRALFEWFGGKMSSHFNNNPEQNAEQSIKGVESKVQGSVSKAAEGIAAKPSPSDGEPPRTKFKWL